MGRSRRIEVVLWSIAFPGFGQILNGKLVKGFILVSLEFIVNLQSNLNQVIISSFRGDITQAVAESEYKWLMFYPCLYMFGIWDAYKDAAEITKPYAAVPAVGGAYFGTIGVIYSQNLWGAVWLGLSGMFVGLGIGMAVKSILNTRFNN